MPAAAVNLDLADAVPAVFELAVAMVFVAVAVMMPEQAVAVVVATLGIENQPVMPSPSVAAVVFIVPTVTAAVVMTAVIVMGRMTAVVPPSPPGMAAAAFFGKAHCGRTKNQCENTQDDKE